MIEFLVDNIYVRLGVRLFQQMLGIPMRPDRAPLLADLFLYSYENEFLDKLIKEGIRKLARKFNLSCDNKYTANDICRMIEFLVDNIYVRFGVRLFQQMVGIPMRPDCAPLLADLFLYSYENEFLINSLRRAKESLLESSIYHIAILMTLSLSIIQDLRSSFLIFTPNNSQFLKPQNLPQLLLISICFSPEIRATT